jgi:SAM-dependent methyltransferase
MLLRGWLARAKAKRRLARGAPPHREELIARLAPGKTFLDMGGMWTVHGEYAFLAEAAGATSVTVCDGMDPTELFERKRRERSSGVRFVQGDLHDPVTVEQLGAFDIVWCTGVIYHSPDPYRLIEHLRGLTRHTLVLGSRVIPEFPGVEGGCIFYPALAASSRRAFAWLHGREADGVLGAAVPFDKTPAMGYANYWWGLSPSAVTAMLELARFEVRERYQSDPLALDLVCHTVPGESVLPPLEFPRERGNRREAAEATGHASPVNPQ